LTNAGVDGEDAYLSKFVNTDEAEVEWQLVSSAFAKNNNAEDDDFLAVEGDLNTDMLDRIKPSDEGRRCRIHFDLANEEAHDGVVVEVGTGDRDSTFTVQFNEEDMSDEEFDVNDQGMEDEIDLIEFLDDDDDDDEGGGGGGEGFPGWGLRGWGKKGAVFFATQ